MNRTYSAVSAARRAAKTAGIPADQIETIAVGDRFTFADKREAMNDHPKAKANTDSWCSIPDSGTNSGAAKKSAPMRLGKRAQTEADAKAGKLPEPPDFSAATHERWRQKLADVVEAANAGDLAALKAMEIPTYSSSPKAIRRYRDLAITALEARA